MTKDIGYVVKIEYDGDIHDHWIWDEEEGGYVTTNPRSAALYNTQEGVKEAVKKYFKSTGNDETSLRVFVQEVKYTDVACWNKSDIDLLLEEK